MIKAHFAGSTKRGSTLFVKVFFEESTRSFDDHQSSVVRTVLVQVDDTLRDEETFARRAEIDVFP